jgi:DNA topoisomerase VI subunit B
MRRLQKAHSREQPGFHIGGRVWLGTQSSLQKMRRSNRPNSRTLQAHHLKSMTKKTTLNELGEMLAHVVKHMATKDDIADLRREMATKDDITRLDTKLTKFEEHEIDKRLQLEVRVTAIEKHLDLDKKIAA